MKGTRAGLLVVSGVLALAAGHALRRSQGHYERVWLGTPRPFSREDAAAPFERERREAERLGMVAFEDGDEALPPARSPGRENSWRWSRPFPVRARECVAVVAAVYGYRVPEGLALADAPPGGAYNPRRVLSSAETYGMAVHAQWCSGVDATLYAEIDTSSSDPAERAPYLAGSVRYAFFRAPWERVGGPRRLTRGDLALRRLDALAPGDAGAAALAVEEAERDVPPRGPSLAPAVDAPAGYARLVPPSASSYAALYRANVTDAGAPANPRVAFEPSDAGDPFDAAGLARALAGDAALPPPHAPLLDTARNAFQRVLAVVDAGALAPGGCVQVRLTRLVPYELGTVSATDLASWRTREVAAGPIAASDVLCATTSPVVYTVPETDAATWRVEVFDARPAAPDAGAPEAQPPTST